MNAVDIRVVGVRGLLDRALHGVSVVGPYTSVNCTITLLRSSVRRSPLPKDGVYARIDAEDDRFIDYLGSAQSVVTSSANNDSGMFETNIRDERFLPFEGAGAVSSWRLELPSDFRPFDYTTISDVILHVRYTARQGGENLGNQALTEMREALAMANQSGLALLFSLRHDFPTEWSAFVNGTGELTVQLRREHFPYMANSEDLAIDALELYAQDGTELAKHTITTDLTNLAANLNETNRASLDISSDTAEVLERTSDGQVFLIVRYRLEE